MQSQVMLLVLASCAPQLGDDGVGGEEKARVKYGVTIVRDARGVPHIQGTTDANAFYGLGYATAEDRLAQMTLFVRTMQGRLAESQGSAALTQDKQFRIEGWARHAHAIVETLPSADKAILDAYAKGVNDFVASHPDHQAELLDALGLDVETWTAEHSLLAWYRVANLFGSSPYGKAAMYYDFQDEVEANGLEAALAFYEGDGGDSETGVVQAADVPLEVQAKIEEYAVAHGFGSDDSALSSYTQDSPHFSHAWVISGDKTASGKPILVSDPQTHVTAPAIWYEFALASPSYDARGIGIAGSPGLLVGFNEDVAWGLSAAGMDQRDLFRLQMTDGDSYAFDGATLDLETNTETILVAGSSSVALTTQRSIWGPVVTSLVSGNQGDVWSLKGTPFNHDDGDTVTALLAMMRAGSLDELRTAAETWQMPSANMVAAGADGDIFYTVLGDIPVRSISSPLGGQIGQEGSGAGYDWQDLLPAEVKPWVLNPADGFILTANHRTVGDWYPIPLGAGTGTSGDTSRATRLRELLKALPEGSDADDVLASVQADCVNPARRDLIAIARHSADLGDPRLSASSLAFLDATETWSSSGASMSTSASGAFGAWSVSLMFRLQDAGPELVGQYGGSENGLQYFLKDLTEQIALDPTYLPSDAAMTYIDSKLKAAWSLSGHVSTAHWDTVYANMAKWDAGLFESSLTGIGYDPVGVTLDAQVTCPDGGTIQSQMYQSYTQVVDFASKTSGRAILPPGNVIDPASAHLDDQIATWETGGLFAAVLGTPSDSSGGKVSLVGMP